MKKVRILPVLAMLVAAALSTACGKASKETGGPLTLKIGVSTAESDPRNIAAQAFADEIGEKTGGVITVVIYPSGQLGGDTQMIDAMVNNSGKVDMVITDASNFATYEPKMGISALPFLFDDFDTAWEFMDSSIEKEAEEGLSKYNLHVLTHYCNGFRCVTNSKHPIEKPEDMAGLIIRTPENPIIMATMSALGANPQPLPFSELYPSLRQGIYDAQENPVPVIYNNKLFEVQQYLSVTNHIYSGMCFAITQSAWDKLSAEQQSIIQEAAEASAEYDRSMNREQTESLLSELIKEGMEVNEPDLAPFQEATASVLTNNASTYGKLMDELEEWKKAH